jgi:hypothetical protein
VDQQYSGFISIFFYLLRIALCPKKWFILKKVPWADEKKYIMLFKGKMLYRHLSGSFDLWCHLVLGFLCLFIFFLDDLSIGEKGELKSLGTTVLWLIRGFNFISVCLMNLGVSTLGAYKLIIISS